MAFDLSSITGLLGSMSPQQRAALIGGVAGAGGLGLAAGLGSKKNRLRNLLLSALVGGGLGAGAGWFLGRPTPEPRPSEGPAIPDAGSMWLLSKPIESAAGLPALTGGPGGLIHATMLRELGRHMRETGAAGLAAERAGDPLRHTPLAGMAPLSPARKLFDAEQNAALARQRREWRLPRIFGGD